MELNDMALDKNPDKDLIALYNARDEEALRRTGERYRALCVSICGNILKSSEDVEECFSDTLLRVWNAIPPACPDNFKAFICRIARNIALTRYKFNNREKRCHDALLSFDELEECIPDERIRADIDDRELGRAIDSFLDTLDERTRNIFIRKYWYFDSVKSIAKRYSFSESKVKNILYRTRISLREYLRKEDIYV